MKREGRSKMAWKERRARALGRWIKPVRVQARTQEEGERKKERYTENVREKLRKGRGGGRGYVQGRSFKKGL